MITTIRVAVVGVLRDSVEDLVPETTDKVAVLAVLALVVVMQAAAAVLEVVMAAPEDLVEVAMEASTLVMDTEEIATLRGLTGGATESASQQSHPFEKANMETTCNLTRLNRIASRTSSTLPTVILLKIQGSSKPKEEKKGTINNPIKKLL